VRIAQKLILILIAKLTGLQTSHMLMKKLIKTHQFSKTYGLFKVDPRELGVREGVWGRGEK
jgi:hypothetical protein